LSFLLEKKFFARGTNARGESTTKEEKRGERGRTPVSVRSIGSLGGVNLGSFVPKLLKEKKVGRNNKKNGGKYRCEGGGGGGISYQKGSFSYRTRKRESGKRKERAMLAKAGGELGKKTRGGGLRSEGGPPEGGGKQFMGHGERSVC